MFMNLYWINFLHMAKQHFVQFFLCFFPTISTLHLDLIQFNQSIQHNHNENILFLYIKQFKQFIYISVHYIGNTRSKIPRFRMVYDQNYTSMYISYYYDHIIERKLIYMILNWFSMWMIWKSKTNKSQIKC